MGRTSLEISPPPVTFTFVMRMNIVNLKRTVAAIGAVVLLCNPAFAQDQIDTLLETLRTAPAEQAQAAQRDVEREWARSGSASMDLLLKRGREALAVGDFSVAIDHFTALTDHAPDFAEGYHARATAYYRADLYGPALDDLETALALNPDNYNAIFGLGVLFEELGDSRHAAQLYRRVLAINPHHENAEKALEQLKTEGIGRTL
jgi:tetratricopeptide (TPR) repeat protein